MSFERTRLEELRRAYRDGLLEQTIPFWQRHGLDRVHGGMLTGLAEDGALIDTDKAVWLQGRAAWTFATLHTTMEPRDEWLRISKDCLAFLRNHCRAADGKLYFQVTREGAPLRMRRYIWSECFAAMGSAVYAKAARDEQVATEATTYFERFLRHAMTPKVDPSTRPMRGIAGHMMTIVVAQELRAALGDLTVAGATCTEWIDRAVHEVRTHFYKPELDAVMEVVAPDGAVIDHFDGRTLNPGHAIECGWFILHEAKLRNRDPELIKLGTAMIDCMWRRGWDPEYGGMLSFADVRGLPVQEYAAEMKFWWPHNEAEIATLLAWQLTRAPHYAEWHRQVHDWSHRVFADPIYGEWFGYAHRDGRISTRLKGNMWKGPFHLPRMQWYCWRLTEELLQETTTASCPAESCTAKPVSLS